MTKYRLRFTKLNNLKYLSHLNLMRAMERAIRRAALPLAFSEGFHPHPQISFGPALAVGVESISEYLDLELITEMDPAALMNSLNQVLPDGLKIAEAGRIETGAKSLNAMINKASYRILIQTDPGWKEELARQLNGLLQTETLNVIRKNKDGQKTVNIRPWLHNLSIEEKSPDTQEIQLTGETGSNGNLRPEDIFSLVSVPVKLLNVTRNGMWNEAKGLVIKPMDSGEQSGEQKS